MAEPELSLRSEIASNDATPSTSANIPLSVDVSHSDVRDSRRSPGPLILDYSYSGMDTNGFVEALINQPDGVFESVESILASNNNILELPEVLSLYKNLKLLELSNNQISDLPDSIHQCVNLNTLVVRNNLLDENSLPKNFKNLTKLHELNLSGNRLTRIPYEIMELPALEILHLGANQIEYISKDIYQMKKLEVLYLGGNFISELPYEIGELRNLRVFVLCDNRLESLPQSISTLKKLKSLLLHRNRLTALPVELIRLRNLMELSLRDNPLVHKFVREMTYDPPSLLELAGRTVKLKRIPFRHTELPKNLVDYLKCANQCVNPRCKGVFFDTRVEHIKFVDFCGKYRVPLLEYLCSPKCSDHVTPSDYEHSDSESDDNRMKKVLLG